MRAKVKNSFQNHPSAFQTSLCRGRWLLATVPLSAKIIFNTSTDSSHSFSKRCLIQSWSFSWAGASSGSYWQKLPLFAEVNRMSRPDYFVHKLSNVSTRTLAGRSSQMESWSKGNKTKGFKSSKFAQHCQLLQLFDIFFRSFFAFRSAASVSCTLKILWNDRSSLISQVVSFQLPTFLWSCQQHGINGHSSISCST